MKHVPAMLPPNRIDAEWFVAQIASVIAGSPTKYTFVEGYLDSTGAG
ncbi:MAG TPA: hypothetical protein VKE74_25850 [Gemmataceae bacterium]|nr:hypothetical protein [Gemmataceae bacterium]